MKSFVTREREHRRHIQVCVFTVINFALLNDFKSYLTASRPIKRQSGLICVTRDLSYRERHRNTGQRGQEKSSAHAALAKLSLSANKASYTSKSQLDTKNQQYHDRDPCRINAHP